MSGFPERRDASPAARALLVLERVQSSPGITATTRLVASTSNPVWYAAERLTAIPAPYRIVGGPELQEAARLLGRRLLAAAGPAV